MSRCEEQDAKIFAADLALALTGVNALVVGADLGGDGHWEIELEQWRNGEWRGLRLTLAAGRWRLCQDQPPSSEPDVVLPNGSEIDQAEFGAMMQAERWRAFRDRQDELMRCREALRWCASKLGYRPDEPSAMSEMRRKPF